MSHGVAEMTRIPLIAVALLASSSLAAQELKEETFDTWYSYILPNPAKPEPNRIRIRILVRLIESRS
jgi:hypothetical protein